MNRRHFFGMTLAAVAAAGLPALVLPEKTIFLPPRWGWNPAQLGNGYMREMKQWTLEEEGDIWRYDAVARDIWGNEHQFHVQAGSPMVDVARRLIADRFRRDGLIALTPGQATQFTLRLPPSIAHARYV